MSNTVFVSRGKKYWQIRAMPWDVEHVTAKYYDGEGEPTYLILQDAESFVDRYAFENGAKSRESRLPWAFIRGTLVKEALENTIKRKIKFKFDDFKYPFAHTDDDTSLDRAAYVEFNGTEIYAHYQL